MKLVNNIIVLLIIAGACYSVYGQKTLTWQGTTSTDWEDPSNWFDEGAEATSTSAPTSNDNVLINNSRGAISNPSISTTGNECKTLTVGSGFILTVTGNSGRLTVGDGLTENDDIIIKDGGQITNESSATTNTITLKSTSNDKFKVEDGGKYYHNTTRSFATPFPNASCNFQENSTIEFGPLSSTTISTSPRTYGNLVLSASSSKTYLSTGTSTFTINGTLTINENAKYQPSNTAGNFNWKNIYLNGGELDLMNCSAVINMTGNIVNNGVLTTKIDQLVNFNGSSALSGEVFIFNNGFTVNSGKTLELQTDVQIPSDKTATVNGILKLGTSKIYGDGTFTLSADGSIYIGSPVGITSSGATGNVQTATRNFSTDGYYYYIGSSAQATGSGLPGTIKRLFFENPDGVTLSGDVNISNRLEFLAGNSGGVITGDGYTITLGSDESNVGTALGGANGHINGKFKRWISTANVSSERFFYTGTATESRNAVITFDAITTGGTILAEFISTDPGQNGLPLNDVDYTINKVSPDGYWSLVAGDGLDAGTYTLRLVARNFEGVNDFSSLRVVKRSNSSSNWVLDGSAGVNTGSNTIPNVIRTGLSGFSEFGIGSHTSDNPLPVELTSFTAAVNGKNIYLNWRTATEVNNYGFEVQRSVVRGQRTDEFEKIGFVEGHGNSNSVKEYSYVDKNVTTGNYAYRLKQIDSDGNFSYNDVINVEVGSIPTEFAISQNYPNPFNPATKIEYALKNDASVKMELYTVIGEKISTLIDESQTAGYYLFDFDASKLRLTSGIYLVRLTANELNGSDSFSKVIKMVLNK